MTAFEEMGALPEIAKAVDEMEWTLPTDVQAEAIPLILGGGDVLMAAETGSGKTGAFCLPIVQIVWETLKELSEGKLVNVKMKEDDSWRLSFEDRDSSMVVTPDGLRCQSRHQKEWHGCRATKGVSGKGRYYYEATVTDEGLCRLGWSTSKASRDLGTCKFGFGFGGTGKKSNSRQFDDYGEAFGKNDIIGCYLDLDNKNIWFSKNGVDLGKAFTIRSELENEVFCPAVVLKNAEMSFNFGESPFKHEPKNGFIPICNTDKKFIKTLHQDTTVDVKKQRDISNKGSPLAIIFEPSRELAEQTFNQIKLFMKYLKEPELRVQLIMGGTDTRKMCEQLQAGVDIIVCTPGRLDDLLSSGYLHVDKCRFFVLDEADALIKQGNLRSLENLHNQIPKLTFDGRRLQMIICSATLHDFEVKKMADRLMHFPTWVDLKGEDAVPDTVHHCVVLVDPQKDSSGFNLNPHVYTDGVHHFGHDKVGRGIVNPESLSESVKLLKGNYCVNAIREHQMDRAIIFCRTKLDCDNLEEYFKKLGKDFSCVCLHSDRKPHERKGNLEIFKQQKVKFLICTDVAARGIDISGLPFMINMTLPDEKSNYVHRIGRVGRAERMGLAISLVSTVPEKVWYHGEWCSSRGKNCKNTNLTTQNGCCIWYNEMQCLAEIEDHLNITIQQIDKDMKVPKDEFDGKVIYGKKRILTGSGYKDHVAQMLPAVQELAALESKVQLSFLQRHYSQSR